MWSKAHSPLSPPAADLWGQQKGSPRADNPLHTVGSQATAFSADGAKPQQASTRLGAGGWAGLSVTICAWLAEPVGNSGGFQSLCWLLSSDSIYQ